MVTRFSIGTLSSNNSGNDSSRSNDSSNDSRSGNNDDSITLISQRLIQSSYSLI